MGAPPPVVTIVDPAAPSALTDVLGHEQPPVLTPEQRVPALLGLAVVALLVVGCLAASGIRRGQRLDREALRGVSLAAVTDLQHVGALALVNEGPRPVSVLSARIAGLTSLAAKGPRRLAPSDPTLVTFAPPASCPTTAGPSRDVELRVQTFRGTRATVTVTSESFVAGVLARCGLHPPAYSLELDGVSATVRGTDLHLGLVVTNLAAERRVVQGFSVDGGLAVVSATPTALAAGGSGIAQLRLRVVDCGAALGTWALVPQQQGFTPTYRAPTGGGSLDALVDGQRAPGLLTSGSDAVGAWVRARCS